jgi:transposase
MKRIKLYTCLLFFIKKNCNNYVSITNETRLGIVTFYYTGFAVVEIALEFSCHINTVYHWISRYEQTCNVTVLPRSGRRRATTPDQEINILANRFVEPFKTAKDIYDGLDLKL